MRRKSSYLLWNIDWLIFSIYLGLVVIGWMMIYAVGYDEQQQSSLFDLSGNIGKQTLWIGIAFAVLTITIIIDTKFWQTFAYPIYAVGITLLLGVLVFGITVKGATSWYSVGSITLQPSELAKFATCLAMSAYLSTYSTDLKKRQSLLIVFGILALPTGLILLQPDAGSAVVFLSFFIVLYREGLSANLYIFGITAVALFVLGLVFNSVHVILGLALVILLVLVFNIKSRKFYWLVGFAALTAASIFGITKGYTWITAIINGLILLGVSYYQYFNRKNRLVQQLLIMLVMGAVLVYSANYTFNNFLEAHQRDRINVWLQPSKCDPQGSLYNVLQSKMAIGSGGLQGKGFLQGTMTKLNYVPEQMTDFIFCTIGEEQGFIGSLGIIGLFLLLLIRITVLAERQRSDFARAYAYCVAGIFFIHFFVNIGMTMGLVPIIGIPLPFISKGGSALLGFTLMIGVLLKLDSRRLSS